MATRGSDRRHVRIVGHPPKVGRRYVSRGKVRIEWTEAGRRRQRTLGDDSAARRREADQTLARLLGIETHEPAPERTVPRGGDDTLLERLRAFAIAGLDLADAIVDHARALAESTRD